ncbi:MAG: HRDC domain-containing protein [Verrucomicrobiota bacterium]
MEEILIDSDEALRGVRRQIGEHPDLVVAMDLEADSLHSYREKICLMQLCFGETLALIDPLPGTTSHEEQERFLYLLDDREVWFHGADFDMTLMLRTFGHIPFRIWDTQLAARLLGEPKFGLGNLIEAYFDVHLPKSHQKANWGARPLPEKLLKYAYDDVRYLLPLADKLVESLHEKGRWEWFREWCEVSREAVLGRKERSPDEIWRISGWGKLSRRALAYLRELWFWRDRESEERDLPPFKVMNNQRLLELAERLAEGETVEWEKWVRRNQVDAARGAVARAAALPSAEWPKRRLAKERGKEEEWDEGVYQKLRQQRDEAANDLGLDPTIVATRGVLETLSQDGSSPEEHLMKWQRSLLFP